MKQLENKAAIVTGATKGIGRAISLAFASEGARLLITARNAAELEEVARQIRDLGTDAVVVTGDLRIEADIRRIADTAMQRLGHVDILVNNAAIIHPVVNLVDMDGSMWREVIEMNLTSTAMVMKAVLPSMIANRSGKVINISSIGGRKGARGRSAYRAAKAGVVNLTESVAAEVKQYGIDVNCICPGGVDTEGFREAFGSRGRADDPALIRPAEIAQLVVFLASEASSAITGTAIDAFGSKNPLFR